MKLSKSIFTGFLMKIVPFRKGEFLLPINQKQLDQYLKSNCEEGLPLIYINGGALNEKGIKNGLIKGDQKYTIWEVGTGALANWLFTTLHLKPKKTKKGLKINWYVRNNMFTYFIMLIMYGGFIYGIYLFFQSGMNFKESELLFIGLVSVSIVNWVFNSNYKDNLEFIDTMERKFANADITDKPQ